jgi:hypothetical protein
MGLELLLAGLVIALGSIWLTMLIVDRAYPVREFDRSFDRGIRHGK